jgi:signal transduction histidine kinase
VTNAIAHTPRGGEITLSAVAQDVQVSVSVADTGCGIEGKHLPRIFDRLYRVSESRGNQNFGLGLTIVKSVLELHGGSVGIQSVPGMGTTVVTHWPVHADDFP